MLRAIGISQSIYEDFKTKEIRASLDIRWYRLLQEMGYYPVILPVQDSIMPFLENSRIEGLLLTGGNDLSHICDCYVNRVRDQVELEVLAWAIKKKVPVFGVCRGMQVIAHFLGSSFKELRGHVATKHQIFPTNSKWKDIIGEIQIVNSYHRMGIDKVAGDLEVVALASDGEIEAVYHSDYRLLGQMWHPEREEPFQVSQVKLIKVFFEG